jgi:hypothetical protein
MGAPREGCALRTIDHDPRGHIVVLDSITRCEGNAGAREVVVVGSFAGAMSLGFALEIGVRGLIAHDAGVGRDGAGVSGVPLAFQHGGLDMTPKPPTFGAPRGTRGAPLWRAEERGSESRRTSRGWGPRRPRRA